MTHILSIFFSDEVWPKKPHGIFVHFCCHSHAAPNFKSFYNCGPQPNLVEYPCPIGSIQMTKWNVYTTFLDKDGKETLEYGRGRVV